jgi:hypothetical protein
MVKREQMKRQTMLHKTLHNHHTRIMQHKTYKNGGELVCSTRVKWSSSCSIHTSGCVTHINNPVKSQERGKYGLCL